MGGDQVRLFNSNNSLIDFVEYDDKNPWPECADGNGGTLELINHNSITPLQKVGNVVLIMEVQEP